MTEQLYDDATAVVNEMEKLQDKYLSKFEKQNELLKTMYSELVKQPMQAYDVALQETDGLASASEPQLTVTGQALYEREIDKVFKLMKGLNSEHRGQHKNVSKCGKDLDKYFESDLSNLIKNEKDIEQDLPNRTTVDRLMFEYFLETGLTDVADALKKESALPIVSSKAEICEFLKSVIEMYRNREYIQLIDKLENYNGEKDQKYTQLMFELHSMHFLKLILSRKKLEAVEFCRKFEPFGQEFTAEIQHLMGALLFDANATHPYYADLFHPNKAPALEAKLVSYFSNIDSPLELLINVGADAVPQMLSIRNLLSSRGIVHDSDELPMTINVPTSYHSTFTCPILKTQASPSNPPVRLGCGHVISREAVNKLCNNRYMRQTRVSRHGNRMKCPYCPIEINVNDNVRLFFN